jgi:hypothetical protein
MIRTLITPDSQQILLQIPPQFVGKKVEIIAFTSEEAVTKYTVIEEGPIHFASEAALAKDWLNEKEETAWKDL